jgi:hypothetical protein
MLPRERGGDPAALGPDNVLAPGRSADHPGLDGQHPAALIYPHAAAGLGLVWTDKNHPAALGQLLPPHAPQLLNELIEILYRVA